MFIYVYFFLDICIFEEWEVKWVKRIFIKFVKGLCDKEIINENEIVN